VPNSSKKLCIGVDARAASPSLSRTPAPLHTSVLVELSNMTLSIELQADPTDEIDLGFQKVDVRFLVVHELLKQISCHVVF
jgi:hypothetical protein